ncbi:MAG: hypothetical protein J6O51_05890 [Bacteroidales bacterium]|nr:hypothetical protein [Bacteroidales bacterium]
MVRSIDIKRLNMEELLGVVSIYPWYAGARMELCRRMAESGSLSPQQTGQAALYVVSRRMLYNLVNNPVRDYSDSEVSTLLQPRVKADPGRIFVVGGDYFSAAQYKEVRRSDDSIFPSFASSDREDFTEEVPDDSFDLCTETLAGIYAEQGYLSEAKQIYSKLSLRYPEKSVYFAALIEKLDKN